MVGDPKRLSDLAKIEADVRIICRRCRFEEDWTITDLARHLTAIGGTQVWSEVTRYLRCRRVGCGSRDLRHVAVPYARRQPNLPRRIGALDAKLVAAAIAILEDAAARCPGRSVATGDVYLALLVLYRYTRDRESVRRFWEIAGKADRHTDEGLQGPLAMIRHRLEKGGWIAPQISAEPTKTWPWNSPAPPGWISVDAIAPGEP